MTSLNFAIVVPTYNRINNLKVLIETIDKQIIPKNISLKIIISNIASSDGTSEYLNKEIKKRTNFLIFNEPKDQDERQNLFYLTRFIPEKIDWVWLIGDDDYLWDKNAITKVCEEITKNEDIFLLCVPPVFRSNGNSYTEKDTIINLTTKYGFHELICWFSGTIMRRNEFKKTYLHFTDQRQKIRYNTNNPSKESLSSAFQHATSILELFGNSKALFFDEKLIGPQNSKPTVNTVDRWQNENLNDRFIHVLDDIFILIEKKILRKMPRSFFRYHGYHYWDHCIYLLIKEIKNNKSELKKDKNFLNYFTNKYFAHWKRLLKLQNYMENSFEQKHLLSLFQTGVSYSKLYIINNFSAEFEKDYLDRFNHVVEVKLGDQKITSIKNM